MPITTDLNESPYFDDFDPKKDYYRIGFKPSVAVQVRELNAIQSMTASQIERLADNLFQHGSILEGCNFVFNNNQPYVKLLDSETNGVTPVSVSLLEGKFVKNSNGLIGFVVDSAEGFEATAPDLKTLFINYINSGNDGNTQVFTAGERLFVYDPKNVIYDIDINDGGTGFSATDTLVLVPKISMNVITGSFSVGDYIVDPSIGGVANLKIIEVDNTTLMSKGQVLLTLAPRIGDLTSSTSNSSYWTVNANMTVANPSNTAVGVVQVVYGESATANIVVSSAGQIIDIQMLSRGENYVYEPYVTVKSPGNNFGIEELDLTARNYIAEVQIDASPTSIGNGYIFGVSEGVIYQKGHMLRVAQQTIIIDKYSTRPNNVVVGFKTIEEIIDSNIDPTLLDNALGTVNYTAPGADRLRMTPELTALTQEEADSLSDFFPIVAWSDGNPFKQNPTTVYSRLGDEIARGISETSGNFVLDRFQVITSSVANTELESTYFTINVDPGLAYLDGKRLQTTSVYKLDVQKGLDTKVSNNIISLNYGNYIRVNQLGGTFLFKTGATVNLYNQPKGFLSNTTAITDNDLAPLGTQIGSAKIRSLVLETDKPGLPNSIYRMYLFDVQMNAGQNFKETRALHYDGSVEGIADLILDYDASSGHQIAVLKDIKNDGLLFPTGVESIKNTNNSTYVYRTIDITTATANNGTLTKDISTISNEYFLGSGNLTSSELRTFYVAPIANSLVQYTNLTGTVNINTTSNVVVGVGTNFYSDFEEGDYIYVTNGSFQEFKSVVKIVNSTLLQVSSAFAVANNGSNFKRVFPQNVPIPFGYRDGLTANVNPTNKIMTLAFHHSNGLQITFEGTASVNTALAYNVSRQNVTSVSKAANRNQFVKIKPSNNVSNTVGPWCIGVPDAFRLRNVYIANTVNVNTSSPNITRSFYLDHNQNPNFLGLGYLFKTPSSRIEFTSDDYLLVEFDYFTRNDAGYADPVSYRGSSDAEDIAETDAKLITDLGSVAHTFEIPEVYTSRGDYYDLLNTLDLRPWVQNTASPSLDPAVAPVNPSETETFNQTDDKKFPIPDGTISLQIEQYLGRLDTIYISNDGRVFDQRGIADVDPYKRYISNDPNGAIKLQVINIPPYPSNPEAPNFSTSLILDRLIANERILNMRWGNHTIKTLLTEKDIQDEQPIVYTQEDIGKLERRIKDLEYYVSLSVLETNISNKVIPSSINPSLNRFKFGFVADDFSTNNFTDYNNPQYSATFEVNGDANNGFLSTNTNMLVTAFSSASNAIPKKASNRVVPAKFMWQMEHSLNGKLLDNMPYIDEPAITQTYATTAKQIIANTSNGVVVVGNTVINVPTSNSNTVIIIDPNPCIPYQISNSSTSQYSNGLFYINKRFSTYSNWKSDPKDLGSIKLGASSRKAIMYFLVGDDSVPVRFKVFKVLDGNVSNVISTFDANNQVQPLSNNDVNFLENMPEAGQAYGGVAVHFNNLALVEDIAGAGGQKGYYRNAGKLEVDLTNANGAQFFFVGEPYLNLSDRWSIIVTYPTTKGSAAQTTVDVSRCVIDNPKPNIYYGTMEVEAHVEVINKDLNIMIKNFSEIKIRCTGLKPYTKHEFVGANCKVLPIYANSPDRQITATEVDVELIIPESEQRLMTDSKGNLEFYVFVVNQLGVSGTVNSPYYSSPVPYFIASPFNVSFEVRAVNSNTEPYSVAKYEGIARMIQYHTVAAPPYDQIILTGLV